MGSVPVRVPSTYGVQQFSGDTVLTSGLCVVQVTGDLE